MHDIVTSLTRDIESKCSSNRCYLNHNISVNEVSSAICKLKSGKSDGNIKDMSDFFINTSHKFSVLLSCVLASFLCHNLVPDDMLGGTVVPIIKSKRKSSNDISNYRSICLSSIVGKILDNIVLSQNMHVLSSSEYQYGFKKKHSTAQCTFALNETIQYYKNRKSTVYILLLDASQAFDRVNFAKMFRLLICKGVCPLAARYLMNMYTNSTLRIRWGTTNSSCFDVENGVKQGGVLSPILFCMYIDQLLLQLKSSGYGCYIGNVFMGSFCYADDCSLLAPTLSSLWQMLKVVEEFGLQYDVKFNPDKSQLLVYNGRKPEGFEICFNEVKIHAVEGAQHLGHPIGLDSNMKHVLHCRQDFVNRVNFLIINFNECSLDVKYILLKRFCMSLYGCVLWDFSCNSINNFFTAWRIAIRRILDLNRQSHGAYLPMLVNDIPVEGQLHKRVIKFMNNLHKSENSFTKLCLKLALNGSRSNVSRSFNFIKKKYGLCGDLDNILSVVNFLRHVNSTSTQEFDNEDWLNIENCKCILEMRNLADTNPNWTYFSKSDFNQMLEFFSVK